MFSKTYERKTKPFQYFWWEMKDVQIYGEISSYHNSSNKLVTSFNFNSTDYGEMFTVKNQHYLFDIPSEARSISDVYSNKKVGNLTSLL